MVTTFFKPSIHGWPFGNSYDLTFDLPFKDLTLHQRGFCGGMCWKALERFYAGLPIARDLGLPAQGTALYNEIHDEQFASLSLDTLWKIYRWQQSPDLSHWNRKHSLGDMTKDAWPDVKAKLDAGKPITLTLIAHANDYNFFDMPDSHRVVAYAYDVRPLHDSDWVHGDRHVDITRVTINIYDPNYPDRDDAYLFFFTGCDDNWIGLTHAFGDSFHGFFPDDRDRNYASGDATKVMVDNFKITGISAYDMADIELAFSWPVVLFRTSACALTAGIGNTTTQ